MVGLASCHSSMGNFEEAAQHFTDAAAVLHRPELYHNVGQVYFGSLGDPQRALQSFESCIAMSMQSRTQGSRGLAAACHVKAAAIHRDLNNFEALQVHLLSAIELEPASPEAYMYLADSLNNRKHFKAAIDMYKRALSVVPPGGMMLAILNALGNAYLNSRQYSLGYETFQRAEMLIASASSSSSSSSSRRGGGGGGGVPMEIQTETHIGTLFSSLELGLWRQYERLSTAVLASAAEAQKNNHHDGDGDGVGDDRPPSALTPYQLMFLDAPPKLRRVIARSWTAQWRHHHHHADPVSSSSSSSSSCSTSSSSSSASSTSSSSSPVLRIGYISRRFMDYPGTQMMLRLFGAHRRDHVHVSSFASGPDDGSVYRDIVRRSSDYFVDTSELGFAETAKVIREQCVDVLIDYGKR